MFKMRKKLIINILVGLVFVGVVLTFYTTFSLDTEYVFGSVVYDIGDDYITLVSPNTSVGLFYKYFDMENCSIKVFDGDKEMVEGFISNGSKTVLYNANGNAIDSFVNVVKGDFNRDGEIDKDDYYEMGKCLVGNCKIDDYLMMSADIDGDLSFRINDLVMLDKAVSSGYKGLSLDKGEILLQTGEVGRVVSSVTPSYGLNQNVRWSSKDSSIAIVDEAGRITGKNEGETIIVASTMDGKYSDEVKVRVDNRLQLSSYEGVGYIGGNDIEVDIKAVDYNDLSCSSSNSKVAGCRISDKKLILSPINTGKVSIVVKSSKYGEVNYNLEVMSVYFKIMPKYICAKPNGIEAITVSGFNSGELSFYPEDKEIISSASMEYVDSRRMLKINFGSKAGRTNLMVKEGNGNSTALVVVDVTYMTLSNYGVVSRVGEEVVVEAIGGNLGEITCRSSDESKGTCRVEGTKIIVTPLSVGSVNVDVYNNHSFEDYHKECGQQQFVVVIQEGV